MRTPLRRFPVIHQKEASDCGPACLQMIARFYGKRIALKTIKSRVSLLKGGISLLGLSRAAESFGFRTIALKTNFSKLRDSVPLPFIAHWGQNHYVVVYRISRKYVHVADPGTGSLKYSLEEFKQGWAGGQDQKDEGIVLVIEPTPGFYSLEESVDPQKGFRRLLPYLKNYRPYFLQLGLTLLLVSAFQLILPFLTKSIVDFGIKNQNLDFIYLILLAQLMLFASQTTVQFIQSWLLLHIGNRLNIQIISDFLIKLLRLPLGYFGTRQIGEILQRIGDHKRIEVFLTSSSLNAVFSLFSLFIFSIILLAFDLWVFLTFLGSTLFYICWVLIFFARRRKIDDKRFGELAQNQAKQIELIQGIQDIKLNNAEQQKRWEWEEIQARLYKTNVDSLKLEQYQSAGARFLNELKNILISFFAAKSVIDGRLSLGEMLAIQYIIGQTNAPVNQIVSFLRLGQDAQLSLGRISHIHEMQDELDLQENGQAEFPTQHDIVFRNVSFRYGGEESSLVLQDINLEIPQGKITAIVGSSGSGKTTLIKLALRFFSQENGEILVGNTPLKALEPALWRSKCGSVMQDGYLFSDTIVNNIVIGQGETDWERLKNAVALANIQPFIEALPLNYNTLIGEGGNGISQGQKQRVLIARAIYKNPEFLFFDEATNALDAKNEKEIHRNLMQFFKGKTVIVVAHRLSTVKEADQIVVLEKGRIIERGHHDSLIQKKGAYYELVRNQLELSS